MHADPRKWKVVIDGRRMTCFEELLNHLHEAGFPVVVRERAAELDAVARYIRSPERQQEQALLDACRAIPDITLSCWSCSPGEPWLPLRQLLKNERKEAGLNVDVPLDDYDHSTGNLRARKPGVAR